MGRPPAEPPRTVRGALSPHVKSDLESQSLHRPAPSGYKWQSARSAVTLPKRSLILCGNCGNCGVARELTQCDGILRSAGPESSKIPSLGGNVRPAGGYPRNAGGLHLIGRRIVRVARGQDRPKKPPQERLWLNFLAGIAHRWRWSAILQPSWTQKPFVLS